MIYITIFLALIITIIIGLLITGSILSVTKCKCGGKYYSYLYDSFIDKIVYRCNKCHKEII